MRLHITLDDALVGDLDRVVSYSGHDWRAGSWRREHAARGVTLHQADCLIGAVTARIGARLATGNITHFPMPEFTVEEWPPGT